MGIHGLWKMIKPAEVVTTIEDVTAIEGYQQNPRGNHRMVIGVDTDAIMSQCISATYSKHVHGIVPLKVFFYKLCKYLRVPATWVFVFDGAGRPTMKNGRLIPTGSQPSWYGPCQTLIKSFGFHVHQAPGEGEAELASLNEHGLIDFIITTDSDVFPFGGKAVFQRMSTIEQRDDVSLTRGGLILIALLAGGDYTNDISGCGEAVAYGLARCGFGDTLYDACKTSDGVERRNFISKWLLGVCNELCTNSQGFLSSRKPALGANLHEGLFPTNEIINLYVSPLTSFSRSQQRPNATAWIPVEPRIDKIASVALNHLGLRDAAELAKTFHSNLWEGVFFQMIFSPWRLIDLEAKVIRIPGLCTQIIQLRKANRQTVRQSKITAWYRAIISTDYFSEILDAAITEARSSVTVAGSKKGKLKKPAEKPAEISVWVPDFYFPPSLTPFKRGGIAYTGKSRSRKGKQPSSKILANPTVTVPPTPIIDVLESSSLNDHLSISTSSVMDLTLDMAPQVAESSAMGARRTQDQVDIDLSELTTSAENSPMGLAAEDSEIIYISDD